MSAVKQCSKCREHPARPGQRWCRLCSTLAMREHRARRKVEWAQMVEFRRKRRRKRLLVPGKLRAA
jgi:hypothetical protein